MARGGNWESSYKNVICPECGKQVDIFNNDLRFSMELHFQSHKSLENITEEINMRLKDVQVGNDRCNYITCPQCHEKVEMFNNDLTFSLQLHSQKHKQSERITETTPGDQSPVSGGQGSSNLFENKKVNLNCQPAPSSIFEGLFNALPPGFKNHKEFFVEIGSGKYCCNICQLEIEPLFSIVDHLKTKLHEENIILSLKKKLSNDLLPIMEYVSFYGSNLCCNLCRCKIDLCSTNLHETIVNVMAHNAGKEHTSKTNINLQDDSITELMIKAMSSVSPVVARNSVYIGEQVQFICKLCNTLIAYNTNENVMLQNFISHFNSSDHQQIYKSISVLQLFKESSNEQEKHDFIIADGVIRCKTCKCDVEASAEKLNQHINLIKTFNTSFNGFNTNLTNSELDNNETACSVNTDMSDLPQKLFMDLIQMDYAIKSIAQFVVVDGEHFTCTVCQGTINQNDNIKVLKNNILGHFKKKGHIKVLNKIFNKVLEKLSLTDPLIKGDRQLIKMKDHIVNCDSCHCSIALSTDEDVLRENIITHLTSTQHLNSKVTFTENHSTDQNRVPENSIKNDPIGILFQSLPAHFQSDLIYIKNNVVGSYLSCTLCDCLIDPTYLIEHLENSDHIIRKRINVIKEHTKKKKKKKKENSKPTPEEDVKIEDIFNKLPKGTFNMDDFKRFYSNEDVGKSIPYFWDKFDKDNYSIWYGEYKYKEDLQRIYMSCNLITGMFQKLQTMKKQAFASMCLFGKDNDSSISGIWVWRGQDLAFELDPEWQVHYESFHWKKLNADSDETKSLVTQYFSWAGQDREGRDFNQGKIFK